MFYTVYERNMERKPESDVDGSQEIFSRVWTNNSERIIELMDQNDTLRETHINYTSGPSRFREV